MDPSEQSQQQQHGDGAGQISNGTLPYPHAPFVATSSLGIPVSLPTHPRAVSTSQQQLAYHQAQQFDHQQQRLESFWADQMQEAERATDFKNHMLPLARVKKIMKADGEVRMISQEAPVVFAKACEMFISELTLRAWMHTEENKRKTLQKNDIAAAISRTDTFDFLVDILPRDELKEEIHGIPNAVTIPPMGSSAEPIPYYYVPQQHSVGPSGTAVYAGNQQQLTQPMAFMPWPQLQPQQQNNHHHQQENSDRV